MGFAFNPFTGNFDVKGAGGGGGSAFFAGEVPTYADLPLDGTAALDSRWLVRSNSGTWPFSSYKQAGVYVRIATVGSSRDNDYRLTDTSFFDVMSDAAFLIYDDADATKNLKFQLSGLTTGTTSTLTVPASGTIARTSDIPSTFAASAITSGTFDNARINFAAPSSIGSTTASSGAFTTLSATPTSGSALTLTGGTVTASAPVINATQTWNNAATTFVAFSLNVTETAAEANSLLFRLQRGGTTLFSINRAGICPQDFQANSLRTTDTVAEGSTYKTISTGSYQFSSTTSRFGTTDIFLRRDAAGVLAQYNAANAQTFRLYSTFSSTTSFERLNIAAQTGGSFIIGTEKGSAGGTARALEFRTDGTARLTIESGGGFTLADAQDIAVGTTTGTKIGTATTQKIGFFNATPVIQQSGTGTNATGFTANGPGNTVHADSTFTGNVGATAYSISDIVKHLKTIGLIAS